jgi:hypothetical protein
VFLSREITMIYNFLIKYYAKLKISHLSCGVLGDHLKIIPMSSINKNISLECDLVCHLCWWFGEVCNHGLFVDNECDLTCLFSWKQNLCCTHHIVKCLNCNTKLFDEVRLCLCNTSPRSKQYSFG